MRRMMTRLRTCKTSNVSKVWRRQAMLVCGKVVSRCSAQNCAVIAPALLGLQRRSLGWLIIIAGATRWCTISPLSKKRRRCKPTSGAALPVPDRCPAACPP